MMRWTWHRRPRPASDELKDAVHQLNVAQRDDDVINGLARRSERIIRENRLGPQIIKALGAQR